MLFFVPFILFDYSQKVSLLFQFGACTHTLFQFKDVTFMKRKVVVDITENEKEFPKEEILFQQQLRRVAQAHRCLAIANEIIGLPDSDGQIILV